MKEISRQQLVLFSVDSTKALERIRTAIDYLWNDREHRIHDKVAGPYDYEELMSALLSAEAALEESSSRG